MLAGLLVASAAGGVVFVYCLMNSSLGYLVSLGEGGYISYYDAMNFSDPVAIADPQELNWLIASDGSAPALKGSGPL